MAGKGMGMGMGMGMGGNKQPKEKEDELTNKDSATLAKLLHTSREKLNDLKAKRNYIQLDRDMVEEFYKTVIKEVEEVDVQYKNKETELQKLEEEHQVELKVYLQKVKNLEYEQEKTNEVIEVDGEDAKAKENKYFEDRLEAMGKEKKNLKIDYNDNEKQNIVKVQREEEKNKGMFTSKEREFNMKIQDLIKKYEQRLAKLQEELELKLKVEIHELEERKNLHINELINNHEKAFAELKKYYNDITAENLNLIKAQKEEMARINANLNANTKMIADMKAENSELKVPLEKKRQERDELKNLLKQFPKHKMSLSNLKSKLAGLKDKIMRLQKEREELDTKYDKVVGEKKHLEEKFENITMEVKRHSNLQNIVLSQRLQSLEEQLEIKEAQMNQVIQQTGLDINLRDQLVNKISGSIEQKNTLIKNLKYSIHHATKAYNDTIRVYAAKLYEFGIPPEELGFQLLETVTSNMPAGLVSS